MPYTKKLSVLLSIMALSLIMVACSQQSGDNNQEGDKKTGENHEQMDMSGNDDHKQMSETNVSITPPSAFNKDATKHLVNMDTKNVTRLKAKDPITMAVHVSQTIWPATHKKNRPGTIILAPVNNWQITLASADLIHHPNNGPMLLTKNGHIPKATWQEIKRLNPKGNKNGTEIMVMGDISQKAMNKLKDYQVKQIQADQPAVFAKKIDQTYAKVSGGHYPKSVIIVSQENQAKLFSLVAINWIAHMPEPVLYVKQDEVPKATVQALKKRDGQANIYVVGPEKVISNNVVEQLKKYGSVTRIQGETPVKTSIAFAKFKDKETGFGWGIQEPGHGLSFISTETPAFALVGAPFAHLGKHAPMIWLKNGQLTDAHYNFFEVIKPTYEKMPTEGPYNHAFLLGSTKAISFKTQGVIDAALEIVKAGGGGHGSMGH